MKYRCINSLFGYCSSEPESTEIKRDPITTDTKDSNIVLEDHFERASCKRDYKKCARFQLSGELGVYT